MFMYETLKKCIKKEVIRSECEFSWVKAFHRAIKCSDRRFYLPFRIWGYIYKTRTGLMRAYALHRLKALNKKYMLDISPNATIGPGLGLRHYIGIIIRGDCVIGENFEVHQNTTIGKNFNSGDGKVKIGDNVSVGANCCILGNVEIGSNVTVGAMSFINKDIPPDHTVYSVKENILYLSTKEYSSNK